MKYLCLFLLLGCLGCGVDLNKDIHPGHESKTMRFQRLYEIDMDDTSLYYTYAMRDKYTNQEIICTVGSCYPTGRLLDSEGRILNQDGSLKYPNKY